MYKDIWQLVRCCSNTEDTQFVRELKVVWRSFVFLWSTFFLLPLLKSGFETIQTPFLPTQMNPYKGRVNAELGHVHNPLLLLLCCSIRTEQKHLKKNSLTYIAVHCMPEKKCSSTFLVFSLVFFLTNWTSNGGNANCSASHLPPVEVEREPFEAVITFLHSLWQLLPSLKHNSLFMKYLELRGL